MSDSVEDDLDPGSDPGVVRKIIHVDMDAFFASVEQRDNPELRGRPVAVGGSRERGVVAAASYEARRFGVRSAMPSLTAARQCRDLVFVRPRFEVYRSVSAQVREVFEEHSDLIEPVALDEAYLDVTENKKGLPHAMDVAAAIRAAVLERTGLTCSAGVSYNKFLAKMASGHRKPDGLTVIRPHHGPGFVERLEIGRFHGVGPRTAERMLALGIRTGADLKERSLEFLEREFGKQGAHFHAIARGIDHRPVRPDRVRKSIGAENTFERDLVRLADMSAALRPLAAKVWSGCERHGLRGKSVTLKVRYSDFQDLSRTRSFPSGLPGADAIEAAAMSLLEPLFPLRMGVRLLGVSLSSLAPEGAASPQLALDL